MPYTTIAEVPDQIKEHKGVKLNLEQANKWAGIFDALKKQGNTENAAAIAWTTWEKVYVLKDGAWVRRQMNMAKDLKTVELKGVEVFKVGKWNGFDIKSSDINEIVANHKEIGHLVKPFVKLGHNTKQELLAQDGLPAGGWITNAYRKGETLFVDLKEVPEKLASLVKAGAYKRISAEIYNKFHTTKFETNEEKTYKNVLGAIAFLGADLPAVTTLSDILAWYSDDKAVLSWYGRDDSSFESKILEFEKEVLPMPEGKENELEKFAKRLNDQFDAFKQQQDDFTKMKESFDKDREDFKKKEEALVAYKTKVEEQAAKFSKLEKVLENIEDPEALVTFIQDSAKEKEELKAQEQKFNKVIEDARKNEVNSFVDNLVTKSFLVPSQTDLAKALLFQAQQDNNVIKFSKEVASKIKVKEESNMFDLLKAFMETLPDRKLLQEFSASDDRKPIDENAERRKLVNEYQKEHKVDYSAAQVAVKKLRPDLFEDMDSDKD